MYKNEDINTKNVIFLKCLPDHGLRPTSYFWLDSTQIHLCYDELLFISMMHAKFTHPCTCETDSEMNACLDR